LEVVMTFDAKYVHTNIVAKNWRDLADFYQQVFGCVPMPPERDYHGSWINEVTAIDEPVSIEGMHLRLPGYDEHGPTLEIFQYSEQPPRPPVAANQPGFAHIAFHVSDIESARQAVLDAGGKDLGKLHSMQVRDAGHISLIYMTDPEGNIIELQHWS
jgi:predicted enzyme related to lactoylglutathione lyase